MMKHSTQRGAILIEVMVAALLFVLGLLGLVGVAAKSISDQTDIQYRTLASNLASEVIDTIWLNVDRTSAATLAASLTAFQHQPTTTANCSFTGAASALVPVTNWVAKVRVGATNPPATVPDPASRLPGAAADMQQIAVNIANGNEVTVRLCWLGSTDVAARQYVLRAYIN